MSINCGGKDGSINQCIGATRNAGRVVVTAIPSEVQVPLNFHPMRRKEIALYNVRLESRSGGSAADARGPHYALRALVTHTRPLEEVDRAFVQLENYADRIGKVVINP